MPVNVSRRGRKTEKRDYLTSSYLLVYLPIRMRQLGSSWMNFHKIWYLSTFRKSLSLKSDKNNLYVTWRPCACIKTSRWNLLKMRNFSVQGCRDNQKLISCPMPFFWKSCSLWDNVEKYHRAGEDTGDNIIWSMCFHVR